MSHSHQQPPVVAILVGGFGTRLRSVVRDVPKPLANIAGEPFLFLLLRTLASYGIKRIVLLTGYMHELIMTACGDGSAFQLEIIYSRESQPLGTAGALANAATILKKESEFILLNGDTYLNAPLAEFIHAPLPADSLGLMGVLENHEYERYGSIEIDHQNKISAFREKNNTSTGWINAGIYKLSSSVIDLIPIDSPCSLERDIFPKIIAEKNSSALQAFRLQGSLHDIGTPESYLSFNEERMQQ